MSEPENELISNLAIVIPSFNEEQNLEILFRRISGEMEKQAGVNWRIIFVDDGSTDGTWERIRDLKQENPERIYAKRLSRNFGHQAALVCGLGQVKPTEAAIMMDADLQHDPEYIPIMLEKAAQGFDIVQGKRRKSKSGQTLKPLLSRLFYRLINFISTEKIEPDAPDFRYVSPRVASALKEYTESNMFLRGIISFIGFRKTTFFYVEKPRHAGQAGYSSLKSALLALDGIMSISIHPIRVSLVCGVLCELLAFLYALYALFIKFFYDEIVIKGWTSIIILMLFLHGVLFFLIGIIGEYVGKSYLESKKRPLYHVSDDL